MNLGSQHLYLRRRVSKELEPFPHPDKFKRHFDYLMYGVGILAPLALLPQVFQLYISHNVTGISAPTWILLGIINALWAVYGFLHHDKPIAITNIGFTILDFVVVIGVGLYK